MSDFVRFDRVKKTYRMGEVVIEALRDASFSVERGAFCHGDIKPLISSRRLISLTDVRR